MRRTHGRLRENSNTYRILESGTKIIQSRNITFIETLFVKVNALDHDHNDVNDDTFRDLESSIPLRRQEEMPETEADADPDTGDSQSGGTIFKVDEESDMTSTKNVIAMVTVDLGKQQKRNAFHASGGNSEKITARIGQRNSNLSVYSRLDI